MAVEGLTAFQRKMALIPKSVTDELRKELEKQASELVAMMQRVVPVDQGNLRASIGWTWGAAPEGSMSVGTVAASAESDLRITIFAGQTGKKKDGGTFYARFQEFGTKNMAANPFFFPSYRAKRRTIRSAMTRAIKRGLKNAI